LKLNKRDYFNFINLEEKNWLRCYRMRLDMHERKEGMVDMQVGLNERDVEVMWKRKHGQWKKWERKQKA